MTRIVVRCACFLALAACGCGGSGSSGGGGSGSCTPGSTAKVTIRASGLSPQSVCVLPGGTVTFDNADSVSHHLEFDTPGCPPVPEIAPGSSTTDTFPGQATCAYHDSASSASAFAGTVAVTPAPVQGPGY